MKKTLLLVTILTLFMIPNTVFAKATVSGLKEAVEEEIQVFGSVDGYEDAVEELKEADLSNYEENDDKVNIYLFRGSSCGHCFNAISYFASIAKNEGKYFNIKSYEVWSNTDNADLMNNIGEKLGDKISGVPYIVVGKKSWSGFNESYGKEIMDEVKSQYNKDPSERYDVMKEVGNTESSSNDIISLIVILLITAGIVAGIIFTRKKAS